MSPEDLVAEITQLADRFEQATGQRPNRLRVSPEVFELLSQQDLLAAVPGVFIDVADDWL